MEPGLKPAVALLVILGLGDLVQVPFVLAAIASTPGSRRAAPRPRRRQTPGDSPPRR